MEPQSFQEALEHLINRHSQENGSNTPDFMLAQYLVACLQLYNTTVMERERWYGRGGIPGVLSQGDGHRDDA